MLKWRSSKGWERLPCVGSAVRSARPERQHVASKLGLNTKRNTLSLYRETKDRSSTATPRRDPALSGLQRPMEILAIQTGPIETFHQPIHPIADAMGIEVIITLDKLPPFVAQIQRMASHRALR